MSEHISNKSELWRSRIDDYRSSGLSAKEWCSGNSLSYSTLCYWISKFKKKQEDEIVFAPLPAENPFPFFTTASPITIRFASAIIEVSEHCHPDLLENLISLLNRYA